MTLTESYTAIFDFCGKQGLKKQSGRVRASKRRARQVAFAKPILWFIGRMVSFRLTLSVRARSEL